MGNSITSLECGGCFENILSAAGSGDEELPLESRLARLRTGSRFLKKAYMGLSSKEVDAKLSEDFTTMNWRTVENSGWLSSSEKGIINLTIVQDIKCEGDTSISFHDKSGTELFSGMAESKSTRNLWAALLQELIDSWSTSPSDKPEAKIDAENTSNKTDHFAKRQAELEERQKERELKKKKYAGVGMKYTAQAMAKASS
jgi:hypothetical protein